MQVILIGFALLVFVAGVAACCINGIATYLIARRMARTPALWTLLAVIPGVNVASSLYFYLTTVLRILDDVQALKTASAFDREPAGSAGG